MSLFLFHYQASALQIVLGLPFPWGRGSIFSRGIHGNTDFKSGCSLGRNVQWKLYGYPGFLVKLVHVLWNQPSCENMNLKEESDWFFISPLKAYSVSSICLFFQNIPSHGIILEEWSVYYDIPTGWGKSWFTVVSTWKSLFLYYLLYYFPYK